jgi:hypothetical protein
VTVRFLADANLDQDIVAGILRREPDVDFELPQGVIPEGMNPCQDRPGPPEWRLDYRSLNTDTFNPIYVLMGHALPEEAQSRPVQRARHAQAGIYPQVSNRGEAAHPSGSVSFRFAVWPE